MKPCFIRPPKEGMHHGRDAYFENWPINLNLILWIRKRYEGSENDPKACIDFVYGHDEQTGRIKYLIWIFQKESERDRVFDLLCDQI